MRTVRCFYDMLLLIALLALSTPSWGGEANEASRPDATLAPQNSTQSRYAYADGFYLRNDDGSYRLKFKGDIQVDGRFWTDYRGGGNPDTIFLRRARPILEATLARNYFLRLMLDFGQSTPRWQDAYFEARHSKTAIFRFGKMKGPIGLERLQVDTDTMFTERGFPTDLVPNRELGGEMIGDIRDGFLAYAAGIFSGVPDGQSIDNSMNGVTLGGRLFSYPFRLVSTPILRHLGIGIAGTVGDESGLLASFKTPAQTKFFSYRKTVVADGQHTRISPQAYYYQGPFGLLTEYVRSAQNVRIGTSTAELTNSAWQVATSFVLTGEQAAYTGINPKYPLTGRTRRTGAVELVARYGRLNIDGAAFPVFANPVAAAKRCGAWGAGINWYPIRYIRLSTDFERASFRYISSIRTLQREDTLSCRVQVQF